MIPSAAAVIMLRSLKMYDMSQAVTDLIEQGAPAFDAALRSYEQRSAPVSALDAVAGGYRLAVHTVRDLLT